MKLKYMLAVMLLSSFGGLVHADDTEDDGDIKYCQVEAQKAGISGEDAVNEFIADCLRNVKICEDEANDADLGSDSEIRDYVAQCLEEFRMSQTPDEEPEPDMQN
jgi:hypothetical protein